MKIFKKKKFNEHLDMLGYTYKDKVTGFIGIASTMSFDLYGCIQTVLTPKATDGKTQDGHWMDINRLIKLDVPRAMELPDFRNTYIENGEKGAAPKPPM